MMIAQIVRMSEELNEFIQKKEVGLVDIIHDIPPIISEIENRLMNLKEIVCNSIFPTIDGEIHFFKEIKPKLFSKLIFMQKIYQLKLNQPTASCSILRAYIERELEQINIFYNKYHEFIKYYRSGQSTLDKYYFVRGENEMKLTIDNLYFERDSSFSTYYDFKIAQILANEMIANYLNCELAKIEQGEYYSKTIFSTQTKEQWTETKVALTELVYGIYLARSVNAGNTDIKVLASLFSKTFNIDLGDIYHTFLEIRNRKGDRTIYLNKLIEVLNKRMDELDSK